MKKTSSVPFLAGLCAASIWGGMYVVSKVVLEVIPPFALLTTRLILGFLVTSATPVLVLPFAALLLKEKITPLFLLVGFLICVGILISVRE